MNTKKKHDVAELTKLSLSTFLNIAQMTQYRMRYAQRMDAEDKEKMIYHTCLVGLGILGLFAIGISGLISKE